MEIIGHNKEGVLCLVPHYSTQIADAWLVVEKMASVPVIHRGEECWFGIEAPRADTDEKWTAGYKWNEGYGEILWDHDRMGYADTAPLAICLAALKAVEEK